MEKYKQMKMVSREELLFGITDNDIGWKNPIILPELNNGEYEDEDE